MLLWDLLRDAPDVLVDLPSVTHAAFSPDDDRLLTLTTDGMATVWNLSATRRANAVRIVRAP